MPLLLTEVFRTPHKVRDIQNNMLRYKVFLKQNLKHLISSKLNPSVPILAPTDNFRVLCRMALYRAVTPILLTKTFSDINSFGSMIELFLDQAKKADLVQIGDVAIVTAGYPIGRPGGTNSIRMIVVE